MKRVRYILLLTVMMVTVFALSAYAAEPDNIAVDGPAASYSVGAHSLNFTASEDSGYSLIIDAPDYVLYDLRIYEWYDSGDDGSYFEIYPDITMQTIMNYYSGETVRHLKSFYGRKGYKYKVELSLSYVDGYQGGSADIRIIRSNKAGITGDGFEYWSDNEWGEELATIMNYYGNGSVVTVPGTVAGMKVRTVFNEFMHKNSSVRKLIFSEGIQVLRNNVASECPNLREVELPSTFEENSNTPFQGCRLDSISFPSGNQWYSFKDGFLIQVDTIAAGYYGSDTEVHVPDGIYQVAGKAFTGSDVKKLYLPESVKELRNQFMYIDEVHTKSSMLDLSLWKFGYEDEPVGIGTIYGPSGSQIEEMATRYGIRFVAEGEAVQYYPVPLQSEDDGERVYHYGTQIYRHSDGYYYGRLDPPSDGTYHLYWSTESCNAYVDSVYDSDGNSISMKKNMSDYPNFITIDLKGGTVYYFKMSYTDQFEEIYIPNEQLVYFAAVKTKDTDSGNIPSVELKAVNIAKVKAGKQSAVVRWKKLSGKNLKSTKKIQIQYSRDKKFRKGVKSKYVAAKKTSYKIKGLKKGKKYYVRIRAYTKAGGETRVSKWSGIKSVKAK